MGVGSSGIFIGGSGIFEADVKERPKNNITSVKKNEDWKGYDDGCDYGCCLWRLSLHKSH